MDEPRRLYPPSYSRWWRDVRRVLARVAAVLLGVFQSKADFDRYLEVCNGPVLEVATNRLHFEPVESNGPVLSAACPKLLDFRSIASIARVLG